MPQQATKKKKGRAPAHQNKVAFHHNPRSKKTDKILTSVNQHTCERCHEKIEWRKQYRKYKPLTQPAKCNLCQKRNVKAAYHTICETCSRTSRKARTLLEEFRQKEASEEGELTTCKRICCVCVKEPSVYESKDEDDVDERLAAGGRKLRLREIKTLERQHERREQEARQAAKDGDDKGDAEATKLEVEGLVPRSEHDDEVDPFLQAIGDQRPLTGEAYRAMLLQKEQQETML